MGEIITFSSLSEGYSVKIGNYFFDPGALPGLRAPRPQARNLWPPKRCEEHVGQPEPHSPRSLSLFLSSFCFRFWLCHF